ncbi:hypothetical protein F4553_004096 [Allocatelliglobosispora scoriae]|uniref:Pyrrolo-quinoline quinone repeat domain-containing protein n=1 Tax=Allocatelliglobosispora scoriae TaxID=643052 RepID=A0A841BNQ4_9ACTN|nr:PQQ-binding-like beta-propeller repeat protein [Allocatelliglobosispora scoriae]MBB5870717.1 hypothetical protein [Allocatelliglobosispora scoriae]
MAKGRATSGWLTAALVVLIVLVSTGVWNPFPGIWDWINSSAPLADPAPSWQNRLGGRPKNVMVADNTVIIEQPDSVEARSLITGVSLWKQPADWTAVAGPTGRTVVITGKLLTKGYTVWEPRTGRQLRVDTRASAVWTWSNAMLDVACSQPQSCRLTAREPASGDELWQIELPGIGFVLFADNPSLLGSKPLETDSAADFLGGPGLMPKLLGFEIDGKVQVVDTVEGQRLPEVQPDRHEQIIVAGGRVLHSVATVSQTGCVLSLVGRDAVNGTVVWQRKGYNLRTISGAGCDQPREPVGGGSAVVAVRPDGREALLDGYDGREVLTTGAGERILGTDGIHAVVLAKDGRRVRAYLLGDPDPLWTRAVHDGAEAAVSATAIVIFDRGPDRIIAVEPATGVIFVQANSDARALAVSPGGLLVGDRRDLGLIIFGGPALQPLPTPSDAGGSSRMPGREIPS